MISNRYRMRFSALAIVFSALLLGFLFTSNAFAVENDSSESVPEDIELVNDDLPDADDDSSFTILADDSNRELTISGGQEGVDYTYEDGVLTILTNGNYTIGMADGVDTTNHRIVIQRTSAMTDVSFVLDGLNIVAETSGAITVLDTTSGSEYWNFGIELQGDNRLTARNHPINVTYQRSKTTITGDGSLTLTSTESPQGYNNFNSRSLTIESGNITINNGIIMCDTDVAMNGGTLTINSIDECIYARNSFTMTDGKLDLTAGTAANACIYVLGRSGMDGELLISGGEVKLDYSGPNGPIVSGSQAQRDVTLATDKTIEMTSTSLGIVLMRNSNLTIDDGIVTIDANLIGIHANGSGNTSKIYINGGETEITSSMRAINLGSAQGKDLVYSDDYLHKNYDGATAEDRAEVSDADITNETGISKPYALITPAFPITYTLGDGALEEGKTNPELYSRVDSFTLNNPIPNNPSAVFVGWTGTDLEELTETVTVPEKSKGPREYTAVYDSLVVTVDVQKVWADDDDAAGKRADSVTIRLIGDGEGTGEALTLTAQDDWQGSFVDVPRYDGDAEIVYTVQEDAIADYETEISGEAASGFTVTNTYIAPEPGPAPGPAPGPEPEPKPSPEPGGGGSTPATGDGAVHLFGILGVVAVVAVVALCIARRRMVH